MYLQPIFKLREHIERVLLSQGYPARHPHVAEEMMRACVRLAAPTACARVNWLIVTRGKGIVGIDPRRCSPSSRS